MARISRYDQLVRSVTRDVIVHPRDLTRHYAERLGISRVATNKHIQKLETEGWIARSGPSTHPVFSLGYKRRVSNLYQIEGLEEDRVWTKDFKPYFDLPQNVQNIVIFGFTEMLNNAIDHSTGNEVFVWVNQNENDIAIIISDNGIGVFAKIATELNLPDMRQALFELSKGKLTTAASKHSGEGIFFTSRMFDSFEIDANNLRFSHTDNFPKDMLREAKGTFTDGTTVFMKIAVNSERKPSDVYAQFTSSPEDFNFSKTIVPMKLATLGDEQLISRSQAKRLIARFDRFKTVILDFGGIQEIGQAFADELFRVYGGSHPEVQLLPTNMTEQVKQMWQRAKLSMI
jgi:anti-sigma regulatory factor (Ser/Thr protein kinase)